MAKAVSVASSKVATEVASRADFEEASNSKTGVSLPELEPMGSEVASKASSKVATVVASKADSRVGSEVAFEAVAAVVAEVA